jgi:hypothetical protein
VQVAVSASIDKVAPGLKATLTATLPDTASGKLQLDYSNPYSCVKAVAGLTSSPKVRPAAAFFGGRRVWWWWWVGWGDLS